MQWDGIGRAGRRFVRRCDVSQDVGRWEGVCARKRARMTQRVAGSSYTGQQIVLVTVVLKNNNVFRSRLLPDYTA